MLDIQKNDVVCDIGSATGRFLLRAGEATGEHGRLVGIDLSERMCQVARKRCEGMPCTWEVRNGDALSILRTSTNTLFDRIAMSFTLELFEDDDARNLLRAAAERLRPEVGRIVVISMSSAGKTMSCSMCCYSCCRGMCPCVVDCRPIDVAKLVEEVETLEIVRHEILPMYGLSVELVAMKRV